LPRLVRPEVLPSALGLHGTTSATARLAGPALGGLLYATAGPAVCFLVNGAGHLVAALTLLAIRPHDGGARTPGVRERPRTSVRAGLQHALAVPALREVLGLNVVVGLLAMNFAVTVPAMVQLVYGADAAAVG